jgi:hypothetical protein
MAYDTALAERIRSVMRAWPGFTETAMFGGVGFLLHDHLCVGIWQESLVARIGPAAEAALCEPGVRVFDITGRPMQNWVLIDPEGIARDRDLRRWIALAKDFVLTLPPKTASKKRAPRKKK